MEFYFSKRYADVCKAKDSAGRPGSKPTEAGRPRRGKGDSNMVRVTF